LSEDAVNSQRRFVEDLGNITSRPSVDPKYNS
jgi:hypothetical protein